MGAGGGQRVSVVHGLPYGPQGGCRSEGLVHKSTGRLGFPTPRPSLGSEDFEDEASGSEALVDAAMEGHGDERACDGSGSVSGPEVGLEDTTMRNPLSRLHARRPPLSVQRLLQLSTDDAQH